MNANFVQNLQNQKFHQTFHQEIHLHKKYFHTPLIAHKVKKIFATDFFFFIFLQFLLIIICADVYLLKEMEFKWEKCRKWKKFQ